MGLRNRSQLLDQQCFFVTTTCNKWMKLLNTDEAKSIVADSLNFLTSKYSCHVFGYVIMPNHLHLILYFPEKNHLSAFMRDLKKYTSVKLRQLVTTGGEIDIDSLRHEVREQKFKIWMERFDDVCILNARMLHIKLDYMHHNPLQEHWRLSTTPESYYFSSAAFYESGKVSTVNATNFIDFIW